MPDALRLFLLGIVLLNLAFVQLTDAVSPAWMLSLWTMTALAPVMMRWHDVLWYRGIWNTAVMVSFAFLVNDALTSGLLHMLEDGLLLAALCQVHLLNNVSRRQRPDLLFFNSFLIAFVTSFFCSDAAWSLCFFLYAALLVPAVQLFIVLPRHGPPEPGDVRSLLRDGAPRSALALLATALVFAVWPRDFRHQGWIGEQFGNVPLIAFADEIRLDRSVRPTLSEAPVMRISAEEGGRTAIPTHWRGVTFVQFDGAGWQPYRILDFGSRSATDPTWSAVSETRWRRPAEPQGPAFAVRLLDQDLRRLFLPNEACDVELRPSPTPVMLDPKADGVVAFARSTRSELRCRLRVGRTGVQQPKLSPRTRSLLCQLPRRLPQALVTLASTLDDELPADAPMLQIAEHSRDWLTAHRRYALPGTPGAGSLNEFLIGTAGGHCEYFATTLALLLRLQNVPCRVVGGYLAHEWDEASGEVVVRQRDAHAWVEVLLPGSGWTTFDATPPAAADTGEERSAWWQRSIDWLQAAWHRVIGFDEADRAAVAAWFAELPERVAALATEQAGSMAGLLLLLALWFLQRRRRNAPPDSVRALLAAMSAVRLQQGAGETPRELLARAQREVSARSPHAIAQLSAAVAAHEAERYAPRSSS